MTTKLNAAVISEFECEFQKSTAVQHNICCFAQSTKIIIYFELKLLKWIFFGKIMSNTRINMQLRWWTWSRRVNKDNETIIVGIF